MVNAGEITATSAVGQGVLLGAGGTVDNTGTISGGLNAVRIQGGTAGSNRVTNSGSLTKTGASLNAAVDFDGTGGTVDNKSGGVISGGRAIEIDGAGTVINGGQITGSGSTAVTISGGGSINNAAGAEISSDGNAIAFSGAHGDITNSGVIRSTGAFAVTATSGGFINNSGRILGPVLISGGSVATNGVINQFGAEISNGLLTAVQLNGGDITNHGTITGGGGVNMIGVGKLTNTGSIRGKGTSRFLGTGASVASGSTIDNSGSIVSDHTYGVNLMSGSETTRLINRTGAEIIGGGTFDSDGVLVSSNFIIDNDGLIRGQGTSPFFSPGAVYGSGVSGTLTNGKNGTIENLLSGVAIEFAGDAEQIFDNAGTVNGDVLLGLGADTVVLRSWSVVNGTLDAGGDADSLELNAASGTTGDLDFGTTTILGFDGEAATKTGDGVWRLTGEDLAFSPFLNVLEGTLLASANNPGLMVDVQAGAILGGTGTLGGITVATGAVVAAGESIGTLNVAGNAQFGAGSFFNVEVAGDGTSDLLDVAGTTDITGGTVNVISIDPDADYTDGTRYTVITSGGGVTGRFDGVKDTSAFLDFLLSHDNNNVYITVAEVADFVSEARTYNQVQVAGALQEFGTTAGSDTRIVKTALIGLGANAARSAFDRSQGEIYADSQLIGADIGRAFNAFLMKQANAIQPFGVRASLAYVNEGDQRSNTMPTGESAFGMRSGTAGAEPANTMTAWIGGLGVSTSVGGDGNAAEWKSDIAGLTAGLEFQVGELLAHNAAIGFGAGFTRATGDIPARGQSADIDSYHAGIYGRAGAGSGEEGFSAKAAASYAFHQLETTRNIAFAGISRRAMADFDSHTLSVAAQAGFGFASSVPGVRILSPFAGIEGSFTFQDGYSESGAKSLNLSSGGERFSQGTLAAGVSVETDYLLGERHVRPVFTFAYERLLGEAMPTALLSLAGSPTPFVVRGPDESRDRLRLGSTLKMDLSATTTLNLSAGGIISGDRNEFAGSAAFRIRF